MPEHGDVASLTTVEARLTALGPLRASFEMKPGSTIVPSLPGDGAALRLLDQDGALELEGTIGEGGMGVVRLGKQTSLGRRVAVKTLREEGRAGALVDKLLREAWVTGSLEHPNIVPIHDVRRDAQGEPLVVLKLIEGVDWGSVMHDARALKERFGEDDLLTHNLGVLMQICRAVAFAHSRGIVHRDIKPDNVRIGSFGEVYLLDWGIAVSLREEDRGRLPLARDVTNLAGTPAYLAPEMLGGSGVPPINERTDVYLLGATLHEILAGAPPHAANNAADIIRSVLRSAPVLPPHTPVELAGVVRRAMALDPEDRFHSADELRAAIEAFLEHRGSSRISDRARERRIELERLLERPETPESRASAYDLFGASRAGFQSALDLWPNNTAARDDLRRAQLAMVRHELRRGDARAAQALAGDIDEPPSDLAAELDAGLRSQEEAERRHAALEAMSRDLDPRVGRSTRVAIACALVASGGAIPLVLELALGVEDTYLSVASTCAGVLAIALTAGWWARATLLMTAVNRATLAHLIGAAVAHFVILAGCFLAGLPVTRAASLFFLLWMAMGIGLAASVERKLWPLIAINAASFIVSSWQIPWLHTTLLVNNLAFAATLYFAWPSRTSREG